MIIIKDDMNPDSELLLSTLGTPGEREAAIFIDHNINTNAGTSKQTKIGAECTHLDLDLEQWQAGLCHI